MQAVAAIQDKVLQLNGATLSHLSTGQIVNLVSNDVRRFDDLGPFWVFGWAGPLETAVVLSLIAMEVGIVPAITGVSTLLMVIPLQAKLAGKIAGLRARAAAQTDERVRITGVLNPLLPWHIYHSLSDTTPAFSRVNSVPFVFGWRRAFGCWWSTF